MLSFCDIGRILLTGPCQHLKLSVRSMWMLECKKRARAGCACARCHWCQRQADGLINDGMIIPRSICLFIAAVLKALPTAAMLITMPTSKTAASRSCSSWSSISSYEVDGGNGLPYTNFCSCRLFGKSASRSLVAIRRRRFLFALGTSFVRSSDNGQAPAPWPS